MVPPSAHSQEGVHHWDNWQAARSQSGQCFTDWGDHPSILELVCKQAFGSSQTGILDYLKTQFSPVTSRTALSLCSGDGGFERLLLSSGIFTKLTGIDFSPARVELARQSRGEHASQLSFFVGDVNTGDFGDQTYDVVFAKAALHHVEQLEALFEGIRRCLRPGGKLVTLDFFGPTRFQWTDAQLDATNHFLATGMPESLLEKRDGSFHRRMARPAVADMIDMDPTEAVRSGELHALLKSNFSIEQDLELGGTLLNLIFYGDVINNFDPDNELHNQIIKTAFDHERKLIQSGHIGSDFRLIIASAKPSAAKSSKNSWKNRLHHMLMR
ncbi:MAG: class I SAM-dependent methyltransferase [Polaromonas sp.]